MRKRALHVVVAGLALGGALFPATHLSASESTTLCTWGGTPDAATGTVVIKPGLTNTPSPEPLKIVARGEMECSDGFTGDVTFDGIIHAGGTCAVQIFDGKIKGLPGVARAYGPGAGGVVSEFLYDKEGNVVGADQPQVVSGANAGGSELSDCGTQEGFTETVFSSTVELWR